MNPTDMVNHLGADVLSNLAELLPGRPPVVVLDQASGNWGDNAIWLGERAAFRKLGITCRAEMDARQFSVPRIDRVLGEDGVVLLHGGGSFGDLYPPRTKFRHTALTELRHRRVIQLPQSIHVTAPAALDQLKRDIGSHPNFTLLARDRPSFDLAVREFDCDVVLCADMAFAMGPLVAPNAPTHELLWIDRQGPESVERPQGLDLAGVLRSDWTPSLSGGWRNTRDLLLPALNQRLRAFDSRTAEQIRGPVSRSVVNSRHRQALRFLSQGSVVITDRLHGHIMSMLIGRPSVLLDNRIGKLKAFHETWTTDASDSHLATSVEEALDVARAFARRAS